MVGIAVGDEADGRIELLDLVGAEPALFFDSQAPPHQLLTSFFFASAALTMWISHDERKIADGFVSLNSTVWSSTALALPDAIIDLKSGDAPLPSARMRSSE